MADQLLGGLIINEILADPTGSANNFDTDGSGTATATDEFVEFYNASTAPIDISGLELWDAAKDNWFTFPSGTILAPGGHAIVVTGFQGGPGPSVGPDDLVFDAGLGSAVMNNGAETVVVYDPAADEYISAHYNTTAPLDPVTAPGLFDGFSPTATQVGMGEHFGNDIDGLSMQRSPDGGSTITNSATPTAGTTNICFDAATLLTTPVGERAIHDIRVGDIVMTCDRGPLPVRWIGLKHFDRSILETAPKLCPVRIKAGALGDGIPARDLIVSRQHRIVLESKIVQRMADTSEVLVAAKHLLLMPGIDLVIPRNGITYAHVLLDSHAILVANGAPAESLYLGKQSKKALPDAALEEIRSLLPHAFAQDPPPPMARPSLSGHRSRKLVKRHLKNQRSLLS